MLVSLTKEKKRVKIENRINRKKIKGSKFRTSCTVAKKITKYKSETFHQGVGKSRGSSQIEIGLWELFSKVKYHIPKADEFEGQRV